MKDLNNFIYLQSFRIIKMNKCEHGQKIITFCASDCCVWKEAAGCESCIKKYHNHMGPTVFLSEQQIVSLVKKYAMDSSVKPKCRLLQEAIYGFFNLVKNELTTSMDIICKNIINQIGYPYLYSNNTLSTFKKLKNKQYKKLLQKDFKTLYELSQKMTEKELAKEESKIYTRQMKNAGQLLNNIEDIMRKYESMVKISHPNFAHDGSFMLKINEIIKAMGSESPKHKEQKEKEISKLTEKKTENIFKASEELGEIELKKVESLPSRVPIINAPISSLKPNYSRDASIDKKIIKEHKFSILQKAKSDKQKQYPTNISQKSQSSKYQNQKQQLKKSIEINEKKKLLIDMMKQKQDSLKNVKQKSNKDIAQKSVNQSPYIYKSQVPSFFKQMPDTQVSTKDGEKGKQSNIVLNASSEDNSANQIGDQDKKQENQEGMKNKAFTRLPVVESVIKRPLENDQEVKQKFILLPALNGLNESQYGQIKSPLIKQINKESQILLKSMVQVKQKETEKPYEISLLQGSPTNKRVSFSKYSQILQLKENQQKSLALLLKSLALNAQEAIPYLESAIQYAQNNLSAAEYLSYLYLQLDRPLDCLHLCNKMLEKLERSSQIEELSLIINNNKAAALNILGRYSQSIVILQKCLKYRQKDYFYKNLGDAYFSISIYEKAIYNYEKALKINECYDETQYNLAVCLYIQQNYFNAKLAIKKALQMQPQNDAYLDLQFNIENRIKNCRSFT